MLHQNVIFLINFFLLYFLLPNSSQIPSAQVHQDSTLSINLLFVGDIMGHGAQIRSAEIVKDEIYNYTPCFEYVQPIVEAADFAVGNLEVTLPGIPPYLGYPNFRSPDTLATAIREAGFDMLVTANNHSNDALGEGVIHTIQVLDANDLYHTGTFKDTLEKEMYYPLIVYRKGFKLVFLNYTYDTNKIRTRPPTMVNEIDEAEMEKDMAAARKMQADAIIVVMHWGEEYETNESKKQQRLAKKLAEWGADLIIGAHPHVVQPIKEMQILQADSSSKKVVVAYSLGNFISNQRKPNTDGGLIFEVTLNKNLNTQKTTIKDYLYIPIWRYIEPNKKGKAIFRTVPIALNEKDNPLNMNKKDITAMKTYAKEIRQFLKQFDGKEKVLDSVILKK